MTYFDKICFKVALHCTGQIYKIKNSGHQDNFFFNLLHNLENMCKNPINVEMLNVEMVKVF